MEQLESQIPSADLVLDDDILDRIDDIVSPGTPSGASQATAAP
jgi:hypothetical protein